MEINLELLPGPLAVWAIEFAEEFINTFIGVDNFRTFI
jgi:hypothetical protein